MYYLQLANTIRHLNPCAGQWENINALFPDGIVPLTDEAFRECADHAVDFLWIIDNCLNNAAAKKYYDIKLQLNAWNRIGQETTWALRRLGADIGHQNNYADYQSRVYQLQKSLILNPENWKPGLLDTNSDEA